MGRSRSSIDVKRILELRLNGMSYRQIAREMGVSHSTVARILNDDCEACRIDAGGGQCTRNSPVRKRKIENRK
ncbi:MAG: helix-turn-helix domain-containing protein [Methanomassiliicoccales archaeon]